MEYDYGNNFFSTKQIRAISKTPRNQLIELLVHLVSVKEKQHTDKFGIYLQVVHDKVHVSSQLPLFSSPGIINMKTSEWVRDGRKAVQAVIYTRVSLLGRGVGPITSTTGRTRYQAKLLLSI